MSSFRRSAANVALTVVSAIVGLLLVEIGYRALRDPSLLLHWPNFAELNRAQRLPTPLPYDVEIGFFPSPNIDRPGEHTDAEGFRVMPPLPEGAIADRPVVAVGDSFVYGLGADDHESWPAVLQTELRRRTINAGMRGFGFDQSVLLAERLAKKFKPSVIVVSFISDDLRRSEMSRLWNIEKPWFEVADGKAVLHKARATLGAGDAPLSFWQRALGRSLLAARFWPAIEGVEDELFGRRERALPPGEGETVACALMERLAAIGTPVLVLAQYDHRPWTQPEQDGGAQHRAAQKVLHCARQAKLATLDSYDAVDRIARTQGVRAIYEKEPGAHHNAAGNRLIAQLITDALAKDRLLPVNRP